MNMTEEKKQEVTPEKKVTEVPEKSTPPMREIRIQTDGTKIQIVKAEVTNLEFQAVLENLLRNFHSGK